MTISVFWQKLFRKEKPRIGLALGGGSMRGVANIGVLKVLEKNKIPIHYISGTSAGSIAAAMWASGKSAEEIEALALDLDWLKVIQPNFSLQGLFKTDKLKKFIASNIGIKYFRETKIPLSISATDLLSGKEYVFEKPDEEIALAVSASCSVPGVFSPTKYEGKYLVDGCLVNNIPLRNLAKHKPTAYIGVNVISHCPMPSLPQNAMQVFSRGYDIYELNNFERYEKFKPIMLNPLTEYISPAIKPGKDFYGKLIRFGEIETQNHIKQIKKAAGL